MARRTINELLADAQARLPRLTPGEADAAMGAGAVLVDTRAGDDRAREGAIPGAVHVPLSVLEWRVDPASGHQSPALAGREDRIVLICKDGYSSSLAAIRLREIGYPNTTDVIGGFAGWAGAGLPVHAVARTTIGAAAVIRGSDGRVLLVRHTYGELNWELPGGGAEPGESAEGTAIREAREETGSDLAIERLVGVYWEPTHRPDGLHHFVFRGRLAATSLAPALTGSPEIGELGWFDPEALPRPISDFTARRIDDGLADRTAGLWSIGPRTWLR